jgi:hypothetical protein
VHHFDADLHGLRGIDLHILHHELAFRFPCHSSCTTQNRHNPFKIDLVVATNNDSQLQRTLSQTHHFKQCRHKKDDHSTHWEQIRSKPHPPHKLLFYDNWNWNCIGKKREATIPLQVMTLPMMLPSLAPIALGLSGAPGPDQLLTSTPLARQRQRNLHSNKTILA